jgi:cold shock CspA family protein
MRQSVPLRKVMAPALAVALSGLLAAVPALAAQGETPGAKEAKGRVKAVDAKTGTLVLTVRGGKEMTFVIPETLRGELAKVEQGQRIEIDYHEKDGRLVAATIEED